MLNSKQLSVSYGGFVCDQNKALNSDLYSITLKNKTLNIFITFTSNCKVANTKKQLWRYAKYLINSGEYQKHLPKKANNSCPACDGDIVYIIGEDDE